MIRQRRDSNLRWLGAALVPWAAGLGLLVSFTANAGTDAGAALRWRPVPDLDPGTDRLAAAGRPAPAAPLFAFVGGGAPEPAPRRVQTTLLSADHAGEVTGQFAPGPATWSPELEPEPTFVPVPDLGLGSAVSGGEADADGHRFDGSTPPVPRAVALSSTTPAPADAIPVEVTAASLILPDAVLRTTPGPMPSTPDARNRYADLIDRESLDREQRCLAEAVYFEARSEPEAGQAAVAQVVLNRVKSGLYPASVCGVVYQNRHRYMGCQFSFACEGKALRITDASSWQAATRIAQSVIEGRTYLSEVGGATHYHADYVRPGWSRRLRKMDVIGRHIFYTLKPGQT